ncbi:hypothetical protein D8B26_006596 [Coccidioides posadasii str. Silveira]|uniref:Sphingoid long-chain base transporter RSB1 n=2 Tax=Coccidioides posadasii TaxID=199306 RepID=E9CU34_COCPS|nr:RTA1 like protein family [Coccidioides posadasii C735 delta SOWgp]EER27349.1 RTA1 like protein family [Coccidioides posadasii C735 delta SOWgp]EFW23070.1 sphingoid long-chain base transporter RSB1 [Coccidioides posadasii str. Silveira]QVM11958.1 hypothetical protein D8B26_006596 [Coccidioides posadasii str. Silveira]|eukprot:XP_003069494.1 RTA1 like protein family [Coccidioides posadasii C735 delta SOWgp]
MSATTALLTTLFRRELDTESCTFETCDIELSWYKYRPSLEANATLTAIFGLSAIIFLIQGIVTRRFVGFTIAMVLGTVAEAVGYVGRILMWDNPWKQVPFMIQICCLTIAPAFLAAGIYFTLSRIVTTFGADNSRIRPLWYPRIFIPCDIIALSLQGAGGGIASSSEDPDGADLGKNIMIAGLVAQVVTLSAFILLAVDFSIRAYRRMRSMGGDAALDPRHARLRASFGFRAFLVALAVSTLTIFTRCVYRVAELSEGWDGPLMRDEPLFIVLEGVMIVIAVVVLNAFNPAICFKDGYDKDVSQGMKSGKLEAEMENETETETDSLNPVERSEDFETRYMDDVRLDRV